MTPPRKGVIPVESTTAEDFPANEIANDPAPDTAADAPLPRSREERIALVAYFKAQQRGFDGGAELEDWLAAERGSRCDGARPR